MLLLLPLCTAYEVCAVDGCTVGARQSGSVWPGRKELGGLTNRQAVGGRR